MWSVASVLVCDPCTGLDWHCIWSTLNRDQIAGEIFYLRFKVVESSYLEKTCLIQNHIKLLLSLITYNKSFIIYNKCLLDIIW